MIQSPLAAARTRTTAGAFIFMFSFTAAAAFALHLGAGRDARAAGLEAVETAGGKTALRDGATVLAEVTLATPALGRAPVTVRETRVEGHRVAELRASVRGQAREEIWIGDVGVKPPRVIWSGFTGPRDADGEA